jgi:FkbH-like protein
MFEELNKYIELVHTRKGYEALGVLGNIARTQKPEEFAKFIRIGANSLFDSPLFYQKLYHLWKDSGKPNLKPTTINKNCVLITDFTADQMVTPAKLFCAAKGINLEINLPEFNSVEQVILDASSMVYTDEIDTVVLLLSEHWLNRQLGFDTLVKESRLTNCKNSITELVRTLESRCDAKILVGVASSQTFPTPGGLTNFQDCYGKHIALLKILDHIIALSNERIHVLDIDVALHLAGGRSALGARSYLLGKMAYEQNGVIAVAREIAGSIASIYGQSHRSLVCDWDNTLWGGEIAELGVYDIVCGHDSADAVGYYQLQSYIKGIKSLGVLLAGASRNNPEIATSINDNADIPLNSTDFASLQVDFCPKSESVGRIANEIGFGPEYMLFLDDSTFELAEVLTKHSYIDVMKASHAPEVTLAALTTGRYFQSVYVSDADLQREQQSQQLKIQRDLASTYSSNEDFLRSISIKLTASELNDKNQSRVVQLLQKSNQFNLTTKRHEIADLREILEKNGKVWAFQYEDSFGPQGIISVVIVIPVSDGYMFDSWVMSCRVLNRTVEQAVFAWVANKLQRDLIGEYIPTAKNKLVESLYESLGFSRCSEKTNLHGGVYWKYGYTGNSNVSKSFVVSVNEE